VTEEDNKSVTTVGVQPLLLLEAHCSAQVRQQHEHPFTSKLFNWFVCNTINKCRLLTGQVMASLWR